MAGSTEPLDRPYRRLVVLGTGTEVGKTFVTVALVHALRARGCSVLAVKPVETGCASTGTPQVGSDAWQLEAASSARTIPHPLHAFGEPVSPHLAAERAGCRISIRAIAQWVAAAEAIHYHTIGVPTGACWTIVETAGGAFSPLGLEATNMELAMALDPALWLLVAPDALGVLHDLRATLSALRAAGKTPDFVVLSASRPPDASTGSNARELERLGIVAPYAVFERNDPAAAAALSLSLAQT